jgi:hypothetical protein
VKRTLSLVVVMMLCALSAHAQLAPAGPDNAPKVGDVAPDFQVTAGGRGAAAFKDAVAPKGADGKPVPQENLMFVSDRTLATAMKYDAANANNAKRYYFLVDEKGKIAWRSVTGGLVPTDKLLADLSSVQSAN